MVDASSIGIPSYLGQGQIENQEIIQYASRVLKEAERRCTVTERECLSIVYSVENFSQFLKRKLFTIYTDHNSLR